MQFSTFKFHLMSFIHLSRAESAWKCVFVAVTKGPSGSSWLMWWILQHRLLDFHRLPGHRAPFAPWRTLSKESCYLEKKKKNGKHEYKGFWQKENKGIFSITAPFESLSILEDVGMEPKYFSASSILCRTIVLNAVSQTWFCVCG